MALKVDISKTSDKVRWEYLEAILHRMGFDGKWVEMLMNCVTTVNYKVSFNGETIGPLSRNRG